MNIKDWEKEFDFQFVLKDAHTGVDEWNVMSMNDIPPEIIKNFIKDLLSQFNQINKDYETNNFSKETNKRF